MSSSNTYEPLGEEPLEEANVVKRRSKRTSGRRKRGGKGKAVLLLGLLLLVIVAIVLAITLPIVVTRVRETDRSAAGTAPAPAAGASSTGVGPAALVSPVGETLPPASGTAAAPVGTDSNTGDIYCYRGTDGKLFDGGLRKTGNVRTTDGVERSEVESCASRNTFFVTTSRLEKCTAPCLVPVWLALERGLMDAPVWSQDFVCQGNQVFLNTKTAQTSFYFKYAANVRETLITECDTNRGWWVPDRELRVCTAAEKDACNQKNLARSTPRGAPEVIAGAAPSKVLRAGPVCHKIASAAFKATGQTRSRFVWWRLTTVNEAEVRKCDGSVAVPAWIDVNEVVDCSDASKAACA